MFKYYQIKERIELMMYRVRESTFWKLLILFLYEGSTAYVMSQEGTNYTFWNASTGDSYELQDVHSPLQSIGCLINNENVRYLDSCTH